MSEDGEQPRNVYAGFYLNRRQIFRGRWILHGYYPKYLLKLFKVSRVQLDERDLNAAPESVRVRRSPTILILCALIGSVGVSPRPSASLAAACVALLGLGAFHVASSICRSVVNLRRAVVAVVCVAPLLAIGGVAVMQAPPAKLFGAAGLYVHLADWTSGPFVSTLVAGRPSANEVAAILVCCAPLAVALAVAPGRSRTRVLGVVCTLVVAGGLLVTQSRAGVLALAITLLLWGAWLRPKSMMLFLACASLVT
ncbi:MAG: hypothetical protein JOY61_04970, partial [Chloroflexi bacterium]|nr:hypothetical protein [Chloroflexota bacterium]